MPVDVDRGRVREGGFLFLVGDHLFLPSRPDFPCRQERENTEVGGPGDEQGVSVVGVVSNIEVSLSPG